MKQKNFCLSKISVYHYIKLFVRFAFFAGAATLYIANRIEHQPAPFGKGKISVILFALIWINYAVEMISRFFPSKLESPGCQKQFQKNYLPTNKKEPKIQSSKKTFLVAAIWIAGNAAIALLYAIGLIDTGILILISLAYGVGDMICILFFCPFQTWFMKNRCCGSCRIYNWDFAMMFTPLVFIPSWYTYTLLGAALLLLLRWEITYKLHPERFSVSTNKCLDCSRCKEKLCAHKKQLQGFLKKYKARFFALKTEHKGHKSKEDK